MPVYRLGVEVDIIDPGVGRGCAVDVEARSAVTLCLRHAEGMKVNVVEIGVDVGLIEIVGYAS